VNCGSFFGLRKADMFPKYAFLGEKLLAAGDPTRRAELRA